MMTLDPTGISHIPFRAQSVSNISIHAWILLCDGQQLLILLCTAEAFSIDRGTGVITVSGSLDSETLDR